MNEEFSYKDRYLFCLARRWRESNIWKLVAESLRDMTSAVGALFTALVCLLILAVAGPPVCFWRLGVLPFWRALKNKDRINQALHSCKRASAADDLVAELMQLQDVEEQTRRLRELREADLMLWALVKHRISNLGGQFRP